MALTAVALVTVTALGITIWAAYGWVESHLDGLERLLVGAAWIIALSWGLEFSRRARSRAPRDGAAVVSWRYTKADLLTPTAWLVRAVSFPIVLPGIVGLTSKGLPAASAAAVAVVGWLAVDILTVFTVPARRTIHRAAVTQRNRRQSRSTPATSVATDSREVGD